MLFPKGRELDQLIPHAASVQVRWQKGHVGHPLNEAADALAYLALRRATGSLADRTTDHRANRILTALGRSGHAPHLSVA